MHRPHSVLSAISFFLLAFLALNLIPSVQAYADSNALEKLKALKRSQQQPYPAVLRAPFNLLKRQGDSSPSDTSLPSNSSSTAAPETSTSSVASTIDTSSVSSVGTTTQNDSSSSTTSLPPTSATTSAPAGSTTSDGTPTTPSSANLPTSTNNSVNSDVSSSGSGGMSSTSEPPSQGPSSTGVAPNTSSSNSPATGTSSNGNGSPTMGDSSSVPTSNVKTTLDISAKSTFTSPYSTSTVTLPGGGFSTVTQYLVVVPTLPPTQPQSPEESQTMSGSASLHTNAATPQQSTPMQGSLAALVAFVGYIIGIAVF
ncbi:hypothetical protein TWF694_004872 [Orbilia ellipsospora]|uniref:Uncharacterized protein n=1 Tax=Orbilia ellipsospora TaxID=2528407 RepID=A0AAV9WUY3_9PEZI